MVIPLWDSNPTKRRPYVTYLLIAMNIAVFLLQPVVKSTVSGDVAHAQLCRQQAFFERWGAIPKEIVSNDDLEDASATPGPTPDTCLTEPRDYEKVPFLSAFSSLFLHGGWAHLLGNMLFLFIFGNNVEDRLGRLRFLLAYLAWGLVATYAFAFSNADSTSVLIGASGAIAGVLGSYLVMFPRARVVTLFFVVPLRLPAWVVLGAWFGIQWLYSSGTTISAGADVAYLAHVAGFLAGVVTGVVLRRS